MTEGHETWLRAPERASGWTLSQCYVCQISWLIQIPSPAKTGFTLQNDLRAEFHARRLFFCCVQCAQWKSDFKRRAFQNDSWHHRWFGNRSWSAVNHREAVLILKCKWMQTGVQKLGFCTCRCVTWGDQLMKECLTRPHGVWMQRKTVCAVRRLREKTGVFPPASCSRAHRFIAAGAI